MANIWSGRGLSLWSQIFIVVANPDLCVGDLDHFHTADPDHNRQIAGISNQVMLFFSFLLLSQKILGPDPLKKYNF